MDIHVFSTQDLRTVFRVLRTALNPGALNSQEKKFLFEITWNKADYGMIMMEVGKGLRNKELKQLFDYDVLEKETENQIKCDTQKTFENIKNNGVPANGSVGLFKAAEIKILGELFHFKIMSKKFKPQEFFGILQKFKSEINSFLIEADEFSSYNSLLVSIDYILVKHSTFSDYSEINEILKEYCNWNESLEYLNQTDLRQH